MRGWICEGDGGSDFFSVAPSAPRHFCVVSSLKKSRKKILKNREKEFEKNRKNIFRENSFSEKIG